MKCKFCKEDIIDGAIKCKHCGSTLDDTNQIDVQNTQQKKFRKIPYLWNPVTIAWLSFLSLTAVGPFLQAKNWKELNNPEMEQSSKKWLYASIVILVVLLILAFTPSLQKDSPIRSLSLVFYFIWYFMSSSKQIKFLKNNNIKYEKKSLLIPMITVIAFYFLIILSYAITAYKDYKIRTSGGTYHTNREVSKIVKTSMLSFFKQDERTKNRNMILGDVLIVGQNRKMNTYKAIVYMSFNKKNECSTNVDITCNYNNCSWEATKTDCPQLLE